MSTSLKVLSIQSSARRADSQSRQLSQELVDQLIAKLPTTEVIHRDVAEGVPLIDGQWVQATFTPPAERSTRDREALSYSDQLVDELEAADLLVIGVPLYNFSVPAALKAWIDQVARAGRTFRYSESGPEGLLKNKRAVIVVTSGGVPVDSPADFATPYLRQFLGFLGIDDVTTVSADRLNFDANASLETARQQIDTFVDGTLPAATALAS